MKQHKRIAAIVIALAIFLSGCPKGYHNLAVASQAVAHSLKNVQDGIDLAVADGVMSQQERAEFNEYITDVALYGLSLDKAIREASVSGASVQVQIDAFLSSFRKLQAQSLGIKDGKTRLAISIALSGAETSLAIIAAFQPKG